MLGALIAAMQAQYLAIGLFLSTLKPSPTVTATGGGILGKVDLLATVDPSAVSLGYSTDNGQSGTVDLPPVVITGLVSGTANFVFWNNYADGSASLATVSQIVIVP